MNDQIVNRFKLSVYLLLASISIILVFLGIFIFGKNMFAQSILLNLSTEIGGAVIIFFIFEKLFSLESLENNNKLSISDKEILSKIDNKLETVFEKSNQFDTNLLYTTLGLKVETRRDKIYQNFDINRKIENTGNVNALYYMWADNYYHNIINAEVLRDNEFPFLRVYFEFKKHSWGCNVGVRPLNDKALANEPFKQYLLFDSRIPKESDNNNLSLSKKISVSIRIADRYIKHWEYAIDIKSYDYVKFPRKYIQFKTTDNDWETHSIDLLSNNWLPFTMDGNRLHGQEKPDFSIIPLVVIEFGSYIEDANRPSEGCGLIDITNIRLSSEPK